MFNEDKLNKKGKPMSKEDIANHFKKEEYKGIDLSICKIMTIKAIVVGTPQFSPLKTTQFINSRGSEVRVFDTKFETEYHISSEEFKKAIDRVEGHGFELPSENLNEQKVNGDEEQIEKQRKALRKVMKLLLTEDEMEHLYDVDLDKLIHAVEKPDDVLEND